MILIEEEMKTLEPIIEKRSNMHKERKGEKNE